MKEENKDELLRDSLYVTMPAVFISDLSAIQVQTFKLQTTMTHRRFPMALKPCSNLESVSFGNCGELWISYQFTVGRDFI